MKKANIRRHLLIANIIMCIGGVIALVDMLKHSGQARLWMVGIAFAFIVIGLVYRMFTVKCPRCDDPLTGTWRMPKQCPKCGYDLTGADDEE